MKELLELLTTSKWVQKAKAQELLKQEYQRAQKEVAAQPSELTSKEETE